MYTSHGGMHFGDYAEYLKDTDQGSTIVYIDDLPEWFTPPATCPVCGDGPGVHESYTVFDASGEPYACIGVSGETHFLNEEN